MDELLRNAFAYHRGATPRHGHARPSGPAKTARVAIAHAREDVAKYQAAMAAGDTATAAKFRRYGRPSSPCLTWQTRDETGSPYRSARRYAHIDHPDAFGLRHVGDVIPDEHRGHVWNTRADRLGWYTDPFGDVFKDGTGLCWGVVYQLPARGGRARFVAGYQFGGTDGGPTLDLGRIHESESARGDYWSSVREHEVALDAARHADGMAKEAAETEREYQTAWQAGRMWAEKGDEIDEARKEAREAIAQFKAARKALQAGQEMPGNPEGATLPDRFGRLCALIRSDVADLVERVHELRRERAKLAAGDFDSLIFFPSADLEAAFCEGAGIDAFPA